MERGVQTVVPTVVLAQAWRGGPQTLLARLLKGCWVEAFSHSASLATGHALARSGTNDIVDAAVVVSAAHNHCDVVTSDPGDIRRIIEALGVRVGVIQI
jgi:hypothetical protein